MKAKNIRSLHRYIVNREPIHEPRFSNYELSAMAA